MRKFRRSKELIGVLALCVILCALILISYYLGAYSGDKPGDKKEISVILYHAGNGGWDALQEGIKRAAADYSANVNYVILKEGADAGEEYATILREKGRGLDGLIVAAVDSEKLETLWQENEFQIPVVAVESGFEKVPLITGDNYEMGRLLGEQILQDFEGKELRVALSMDTPLRDRP